MIFFQHIYRAPHVQCCLMNKAPSNIVNLKNELYIYNNGSIWVWREQALVGEKV